MLLLKTLNISGETVAVSTASNMICCSKFLLNKSSSTPISAIAIIKLNLPERRNQPAKIFEIEILENTKSKEGNNLTSTAIAKRYKTSI